MYHDLMAADVEAPKVLATMGHPLRWAILSHLARSDQRVGELTQLLSEPQNLVSYHLRELRDAGLVSSRRSSFDGRDAYYRVNLARCGEIFCESAATLHPALQLEPKPLALPTGRGRTPRVLFLCTGNSARSQMAEAMIEHHSDHAIHARSAGSHPKPLHPNAVQVMAERGIDISGHTTKHLRTHARSRFDHVVTLCDKVREVCPEFPHQPTTSHWSMPDPAAQGSSDAETYPAFEQTAAELETRVPHLIGQLSTSPRGTTHAR